MLVGIYYHKTSIPRVTSTIHGIHPAWFFIYYNGVGIY